MSEPELPGDRYRTFLRYWSFDSLDVKEAEHKDSAKDDESQDQRSGPPQNFAGARSYLRFLREPDLPEHLTDGSDDSNCKGDAHGMEERLCDACSLRGEGIDRVKYFHVLPDSPLLLPAPSEDESEGICVNLHHNDPDLWAEEPNFYRALAADGMGFLSQVAHVCLYARLSNCDNPRCLGLKQKMQDNNVPNVKAWPELSNWALTAMSCQHHHRDKNLWGKNLTSHSGHTHIASAVAALSMVLSECSRPCYGKILFRGHLDGVDAGEEESGQTLLSDVWDLLYWMISIQYNYSVGPDRFGRWGSDMLSTSIESRFILRDRLEKDLQWLEKANVCKFRVWNFLDVGDRDDADLLAIVSVLKHHQHELGIEEDTHKHCTPGFCQKGNVDCTKVVQAHTPRCEDHDSCDQLAFDLELVNDAVVKGHSTAWICDQEYEQPELITDGNDYVAISHVWADGTGVGDYQRDNKSASMVNRCLWESWQNMVGQVWKNSYNGPHAVWWDTVSIPRDTEQRSMALRSLHRNYSGAKCTIVHDKLLAAMTTPNNAVRCVALVLSNWFSRGWTALELQMSNEVWVVFDNTPIPLDDILAKSPATAHPVHWLATTMIKRLQAPIDDVGDILHILKARSTSWARDKTIIAALLADVPNFDNREDESVMTQNILKYLGKIPSLSLLHGEPTMKNVGPWSWCPSTLFDMPVAPSIDVESRTMSDFLSLLDITSGGGLSGKWLSRAVEGHDSKTIQVFGRDNSSRLKVRLALQQVDKCYLLRPQSGVLKGEPALLVKMIGEMGSEDDTPNMSCQYVGAVWETEIPENNNWQTRKVLIGPKDESGADENQWEVYLPAHDETKVPTWLEEAAPVDDWLEQGESYVAQLSKVLLGSDEDSPVNPLLESILRGNPQSVQYQLESTLSKDEFDFGMIEDLKSTAAELDAVEDGQLSDIINGLWLLGDYALKFRDFENTSSAYLAAHELATRYLEERESPSEDIPAHTYAMLWYQRGLALLLKADYKPAIECLQHAVPGKVSKVTNQVITQRTMRNGRRSVQYRRVSSYMVARDWGAETEAWYRVRRSALGALILLSVDPRFKAEEYGGNLDPPEKYFLDSIRHEDRVLFSGDEQGNVSELGFGIIRYCLKEKGTDENELPQYGLGGIQTIANALKSVLEKFDTLFQKEHILCCISALCLGVTSQMTAALIQEDSEPGGVQKREYEALASAQFKRVREDLMNVLPYVEEMGPQDWALYIILTSHCPEIGETVTEE